MPAPLLGSAIPGLLAGGGTAAGGAAAAGGTAALGTTLAGAGTALSGIGALYGAISGNKGQQAGPTAADSATLYGLQGQVAADRARTELATLSSLSQQAQALKGATSEMELAAQGQLGILQDAQQRAQTATAIRGSEALGLQSAGIEALRGEAQLKLATEAYGPELIAGAAETALAGQNQLAQNIAASNLQSVALDQALERDIARTRASTQSQIELTKAKARAEDFLKQQGFQRALGGRAMFA